MVARRERGALDTALRVPRASRRFRPEAEQAACDAQRSLWQCRARVLVSMVDSPRRCATVPVRALTTSELDDRCLLVCLLPGCAPLALGRCVLRTRSTIKAVDGFTATCRGAARFAAQSYPRDPYPIRTAYLACLDGRQEKPKHTCSAFRSSSKLQHAPRHCLLGTAWGLELRSSRIQNVERDASHSLTTEWASAVLVIATVSRECKGFSARTRVIHWRIRFEALRATFGFMHGSPNKRDTVAKPLCMGWL